MKKIDLIKRTLMALSFLLSSQVYGQCEIIGLDTVYCSDAGPVTMTGSPGGGTFTGAGVTGNEFDPTIAGAGTFDISYETNGDGAKYYLRSNVGEPWSSTSNPDAMDAAFGVGEWTLAEFESLDPAAVFSSSTRFVFMDGSDSGASELADFLSDNLTTIENWVEAGGRLLLNAAPNGGGDIGFGFGGSTLAYDSPSGSVDVVDTDHPAFLGPLTPTAATMTGSSYSHGHIIGSDFVNVLVNSSDPTNVVLCEKPWGAGWVMMGGMTTSNFHLPATEANNWRANLLTYLYDVKSKFYLRVSAGEPWGSSSNTDAMDAAFGSRAWSMDFFESADASHIFSPTTGVVFMDGSDMGAEELATFLSDNMEAIEHWVNGGGSLLLNAAPNEGGDIDFGFDGSTLIYADASSSVDVVDLSHPAYMGPLTPTAATMTGSSYSHGHITGTGFTNVLVNSSDATNIVLCEKEWGEGMVMMGGMTTSNYHSPATEANNYRANLLSYLNDVYDGFSCATTQEVTVLEPLTIDYVVTSVLDGGDGAIDISVTGGYPGYSYDWDNDGTGDFDDPEDLTSLGEGTYILEVEDSWGCTTSESITVVETAVSVDEESSLTAAVFPNPTQGKVTIQCEGQFSAQLMDLNGRILTTQTGSDWQELNLESLESGVYFLVVSAGNAMKKVKIIKQ